MATRRKPGNANTAANSQRNPVSILNGYYGSLEKNPALKAAINTRVAQLIEEWKSTHKQAWGHYERNSKGKSILSR